MDKGRGGFKFGGLEVVSSSPFSRSTVHYRPCSFREFTRNLTDNELSFKRTLKLSSHFNQPTP